MRRISTFRVTVGANAIGTALGSLTPPEGKQYHLLGLSWFCTGAGSIGGFIETDQYYLLRDGMEADANNPVPLDDILPSGKTLAFAGTDTSGAPNAMMVMVIYEEMAAGA